MTFSSDELKKSQFNTHISFELKEIIKAQAKKSGLTTSELCQQILESHFQDSQMQTQDDGSFQPQNSTSQNSHLKHSPMILDNYHQVIQTLCDRVNRLEQIYVYLMTENQSLRNQLNFLPLSYGSQNQPVHGQDGQFSKKVEEVTRPENFYSDSTDKSTQQQQAPQTDIQSQAERSFPEPEPESWASAPSKPETQLFSPVHSNDSQWMVFKDAFAIACQNGYQQTSAHFRAISQKVNPNQEYAKWGLFCDPSRKGNLGKPGKWFRRLSDSDK